MLGNRKTKNDTVEAASVDNDLTRHVISTRLTFFPELFGTF
jgi:hypothetical protein